MKANGALSAVARIGTILTFAAVVHQHADAASPGVSVPEYKLKAALVYNFALFTEWPAEALREGSNLLICINRDSGMRPALMDLSLRVVRSHPIVIQLLADYESGRHCHVQFLDGADHARWPQIRRLHAGGHVLTIADQDWSGNDGAVISLTLENQRIGFTVDLNAARQAKLGLSSKLLRLARSTQQ